MDHDPLHAPAGRSVAEHGTLAEAQVAEVRRVLLRNSVAALQHLASQCDLAEAAQLVLVDAAGPEVLSRLAANPACTTQVVSRLSRHHNLLVAARACLHPEVTTEIACEAYVDRLARGERTKHVADAVGAALSRLGAAATAVPAGLVRHLEPGHLAALVPDADERDLVLALSDTLGPLAELTGITCAGLLAQARRVLAHPV